MSPYSSQSEKTSSSVQVVLWSHTPQGNVYVVHVMFHTQMLNVWPIYLHLGSFGVNVGKYYIHWASGIWDMFFYFWHLVVWFFPLFFHEKNTHPSNSCCSCFSTVSTSPVQFHGHGLFQRIAGVLWKPWPSGCKRGGPSARDSHSLPPMQHAVGTLKSEFIRNLIWNSIDILFVERFSAKFQDLLQLHVSIEEVHQKSRFIFLELLLVSIQ